jgi:UDP-glucose 4-epimerase
MNVLVVGSKGFIGEHVFDYFSAGSHYQTWGCDVAVDYSASRYFSLDASNSDFVELFESIPFDVCINCSGAASVPDSLQHPLRDFSLNTFNVIKLLDAIRRHRADCRFINLSSAAVYGNPVDLPIKENSQLLPVSPYGLHKAQAEALCESYFKHWKVSTCSLRIFSAYGPGLKKQLFWDLFQKAQQTRDEIELFGTGEETRDFIFIEDILRAIDLVIESASFCGESINVANGVQISIKEAVFSFYELLGWKGNIKFKGENRIGDPLNWMADISELTRLGYKQKVGLKIGLSEYVRWLRELK